jgi:hypothetical protein
VESKFRKQHEYVALLLDRRAWAHAIKFMALLLDEGDELREDDW